LVTGRYSEAKQIILGFASVLRHGLIPNLLDGGNNPRYNARDATWWFLQAVQDYCTFTKESVKEVLKWNVRRLFPSDNQHEISTERVEILADVIQEIMHKHVQGIHFREWNAGS
jgi:glycogen debranching enzyme